MIGRQTKHYQPGTVLNGNLGSLTTMDLHLTRCENKPSPACEHTVPSSSSRAELLIRTIAETNMAMWSGPLAGSYDQRHGLV